MSSALLSLADACDAAQQVLTMVSERGLTGAASINAGTGFTVTVRNSELDTVEHHRDKSLALTVYDRQATGVASTSDFRVASLGETVEAAANIARRAEADPYAGLVEKRYLAPQPPDLDLDHPWDLDVTAAIEIARRCDDSARRADNKITQVDEASVTRHRGLRVYGSTDDFLAGYFATRHNLTCICVAGADDAKQRGYWYSTARSADALEAVDAIGVNAARRTVAKLGARKLSTRKAPVLFEPRMAIGLISHLLTAISGPSLYRRASFLCDRVDTQVMPEFLTINETPHLRAELGSAPFDGEGVATRATSLIDHGVLRHYLLDSYAARRLGANPSGHAGGVHNLTLEPGTRDFGALVEEMHRGLIVTDMMGSAVNIVSGDYSRGASGFWIENGEIQYPVEEITVAGNLADMYRHIVANGNDIDHRSSVRSGSILIEEMMIAGG